LRQLSAQKGNPSLWSGTPFCVLKVVRPPGNSIGGNPAAFAWRALVFFVNIEMFSW